MLLSNYMVHAGNIVWMEDYIQVTLIEELVFLFLCWGKKYV